MSEDEIDEIKTRAWATLARAMDRTPIAERQGLVDVGRAIDALCTEVRRLREGGAR